MDRTDLPALTIAITVVVAVGLVALGPSLFGPRVVEEEATDVPAPSTIYDPTSAGELLPPGYRQVLPRDAIRPIYAPTYRSAADTDWADDVLVLGVELNGDARAYPINVLNRREMVIDVIGDLPVLATW